MASLLRLRFLANLRDVESMHKQRHTDNDKIYILESNTWFLTTPAWFETETETIQENLSSHCSIVM